MKKSVITLLIVTVFVSFILNTFNRGISPPCFNADEAAFSYNAYSLLHTGRDEYGNILPLRLKSFGDYKMPLYSYLSVPFIAIAGLNETSARMLNSVLSILFPLAVFLVTRKLFKNDYAGVISAALTSVCLGLHLIGRQAHEAYLAGFMVTLSLYLFIKAVEKYSYKNTLFFIFAVLLSLFSYQSNRVFAVFFFIVSCILLAVKRTQLKKPFIFILFAGILLFAFTDLIYKPARVANLIYFADKGLALKLMEIRTEGGNKFVYNKVTQGVRDVFLQHLTYFSPQFFTKVGDSNLRFGYEGMSLIDPISFLFIFIGIYYLFKNKEKWRFLLISLCFITPITASLSWNGTSLTRSFFLVVETIIISSYGFYHLYIDNKFRYKKHLFVGLTICMLVLLYQSWDFYYFHYPKKALVQRTWQCGYKDLADYIKTNYSKFDTFYITKKNGEPYIFLLFYLQYPPSLYQKQASLTKPDQYGFGQVEAFDKFNFNFKIEKNKKSVAIGYPDDFNEEKIDKSKIKVIRSGTEQIFWIYESQ